MRAPLLVTLALLAACSEYDLHKGTDPVTDSDDTGAPDPDDTGYWGEDCADRTVAGFEASVNEECENEVQVGSFTPVVEWRKASWSTESGSNQIMSAPIVTTLNDDNGDGVVDEHDTPDIVVVTYGTGSYSNGGVLRAISGADGSELWSVVGAGLQGTGGAAAADIDGDGLVEVISLTQSAAKAFTNEGALKWTSDSISGAIYGTSDVPAISDMDHDGNPEIIAGRAILSNTGKLLGTGSYGRGGVSDNVGTCSFAADVDANGREEVVTGNALYRRDGSLIWYNGQTDGYPAVADFDGDGDAEVAVSGSGKLRLQDTDGTVLWTQSIPGAGSSYYGGPPTIADFDGDGEPEIGVASGSRYSVFKKDGTLLWQQTTDDSSSGNTGSAVFDFEGDGAAEVVYADQSSLWVFSGADGSVKLKSGEHSNGTWLEYPVIADVDGDDHAEIVVVHTTYGSPSYSGLSVVGDADDSWMPGRRTWNQHAYHITNVNDDGSIPTTADLNWLTYNNFRSGDVTMGDGLIAPDLKLAEAGICEVDCDEDRLLLWVHPGNEGASDVAGTTTVTLYAVQSGSKVALGTQTVSGVTAGLYLDSLQFDVDGLDFSTVDRFVVEISALEMECDETNNSLVIEGPFCE